MHNYIKFVVLFGLVPVYAQRDPFSFENTQKSIESVTLSLTQTSTQSKKELDNTLSDEWTIQLISDDVIVLQDNQGNMRHVKKDASKGINK